MKVAAAEGCSCVTDGWFPSPWLMGAIVAVLLAGSFLAALRLRRRAGGQPGSVGGEDPPRVAKVGLVTVTLPSSPPHGDDAHPDDVSLVAGRDGG